MIRYRLTALPNATQQELQAFQAEVDAILDYAQRVEKGKTNFSNKNKRDNKAFQAVRETLTTMCAGSCRCMYCEDSCADEVEHISPKDLYPETVFVWENYTYACGPCNGGKLNKFAVFAADGQLTDVTRRRNALVIPPVVGDAVLLNPRFENPFDFLELDLTGTFVFRASHPENTREYERGDYTTEVLKLNRSVLAKARRNAYRNYRARLSEYISLRDQGASQAELDELISGVQEMDHPTVWQEMQRQHPLIPELSQLFTQAPEALRW
jgi:uncharacterized protein (TIGR02646 family)